jgi:hypothetical protein
MKIKKKIIGSFDLLFLFGRGIEVFSGTTKDAWRSLLLAFSFFPLSLAMACLYPPKGMEEGYTHLRIATTFTLQFLLSFIFTTALVFLIAKALNKTKKFWLFFEAVNWTGAVFNVVTIPFAVMAITGIVPREEMDRILAILSCYSYVVIACIAYRALHVNWQIAATIAIITLFVGNELWHALYAAQGIPLPW